jgi:phosphohistidine phosphatase
VELLIVRHGAAVERGTPGIADDERPLTPDGERKFQKAARGIARVLDRPDAILTSPLPRARRTAELLAEAFGGPKLTETAALSYGSIEDLRKLLAGYAETALVAVVGHEPYLSDLLARLIDARGGGPLEFKKGGVALVELPEGPGHLGRLQWFAPPKLLREIE